METWQQRQASGAKGDGEKNARERQLGNDNKDWTTKKDIRDRSDWTSLPYRSPSVGEDMTTFAKIPDFRRNFKFTK
jgi:hypothetical protein